VSKISDLKDKARQSKELRDQRIARVREVVSDVVNSQEFELTALNHLDDTTSREVREKFSNNIAVAVAEVTMDPVIQFMDICKARGMKESAIRYSVNTLNSVFGLVPEGAEFAEKRKALAQFLQDNPKYYDDLSILG